MLLTTTIKRQLCVFTVLALTALGLTFFTYAKVPALVGVGVYDVSVEYDDASGLYPRALVTYRGVKVGRVQSMELADGATVVTLRIDDDAKVPTDARAELRSTSAIGEQYVDLVSGNRGGPYLKAGHRIPKERAVEMPQISPVLNSLVDLLDSVPAGATREVLGQINTGFGGAGRDVEGLVDSVGAVVDEAQRQINVTTSLIDSLQPVLATQQRVGGLTRSQFENLAAFSTELARGDKDLSGLLAEGAPGLDSARAVLEDISPTLPVLLRNTQTVGSVLRTYLPNLQQTLIIYPATIARLQSAVNPRAAEGDVQLDLRAAVNSPPSCIEGYLPARERRSPAVDGVRPVDSLAHCEGASSRPASVRGARNLPCPDSSVRGALPEACGLVFDRGQWVDERQVAPGDLATDGSGAQAQAVGADRADGWKALLLKPLEADR